MVSGDQLLPKPPRLLSVEAGYDWRDVDRWFQKIWRLLGPGVDSSAYNIPNVLETNISITYHTYDLSTPSGTQTLTGAGGTPRAAIFLTGVAGGVYASIGYKWGAISGRLSIFNSSALTGGYVNTLFAPIPTAGNQQVGYLTFNDDGGVVTWAKTGTPTGTLHITPIWFL
jgi:hypothetical protein